MSLVPIKLMVTKVLQDIYIYIIYNYNILGSSLSIVKVDDMESREV